MIYITGDTHGDARRFEEGFARKMKKDDTIIICGDFGFIWDGGEQEEKILKKLSKKKYTIAFVDGTHENFERLNQYEVTQWNGGKVHKITPNIYHLMRGQLFTIEDKNIFTFGGGESPDKEMRLEAGTWWECEMPTLKEMREGVDNLDTVNRTVDYVITHEPPTRVRNMMDPRNNVINALDAFLDELSKEVKFEKWFFGCVHIDRKITAKNYAVFRDIIPVEPIQKKRR